MAERCAVVGIGQTKHAKVRDDVSMAGLLREASQRALDDAEMTWRDIDAVVIGTAPDPFEGVMMPELYLADALGRRASRSCGCTPPDRWAGRPPWWRRTSCRRVCVSGS